MITLENILGLLGILLTAFFGIWGIFVVVRRRYPGEISLVIDGCIGLFDAIVKNFPDLAVLYHDQPVSHGLVLFKGTFLNSGQKDIKADMIEQKLHIALPDNYKWLSAKIIESSENVVATVTTHSNSLEFTTGLFRCSEYFRFEALAEIPISEQKEKPQSISSKLIDGLKPEHRIADTRKVKKIQLPPPESTKRRFKKRIMLPIAIGLLLLGIIFITISFIRGLPAVTHFMVPDGKGNIVEVSVKANRDGSVKISSKDKTLNSTVPAQEFFSRKDIAVKVVPNPEGKYMIFATLIGYIIAPIIWLILMLTEQRKWTKLRCQIGLSKHPQQVHPADPE